MSYSSSPRKEVRFTGGEFTYNPNFLKTPLLQYTETQFSKYQLNKRAEKIFISNKKNEFAKFLDEIRLKNCEKANRRSKLLLQLSGKIIKDNPEQEFLISVKAEIEKVLKEFELKMEKERLLTGVLNSMENRICTKKQMALLEFNQLQRIITNFDLQLKTIDLQNSSLQAECKEMNRKLKEIQEQTFEEQLYCEDLLNIKKKTLNESEIEKTNVFEVYSQIKQNLIKGKTLFNNEKETLEALEKKYKANLQINNKIFEWLDDFDKIEKMFMIEKPNLNQQKSLLSLGIHQFSDNKIGENNINNNLNPKKSKFLAHKVKADGKVYSEIVKQIIKKKHQVEATASPEKTYNRKQIMERIQRFYNDHIDVPAFFTQMLNTYNKFCLTEKSLLTRIDDLNYQKKKLSDQLEEYKSICHFHESSLQTQLDQQTILHNEEFLLEDLKEKDNLIDIKKFDLNVIKKFEGFWFNCFLFLNETLYRFASMMKSIQIISGRKESFIIHEFTRIINNTRNYHHKFVSKENSPTNFQRSSNKHLSIKNSLTEINNNLSKKEEVLNLLISHFPNEKKNQLNEILMIIKKDFLIFFFIEIETLEEFIINTIKPLYEKKEKDLLKILEENLSKMKEQASSNFLNSFVNLLSKFSKIFGILQTDKGNKDFGFEKIINEFENKRKSTNISVPFKESKPKFEEIVIDDNIENEYISKLRKKSKLQETGSLLDSDEEENLKNSALNELKIDFDKKKLNEITNLLQNGTLNQQSVSLGRKFQDFARELIGNKTRVFPKIIKRYVMGKESRILAEKARSTSRENKKYIKDYKEDSFEKTKIINENKQKNTINKNEYTELIGEINKIVKSKSKSPIKTNHNQNSQNKLLPQLVINNNIKIIQKIYKNTKYIFSNIKI